MSKILKEVIYTAVLIIGVILIALLLVLVTNSFTIDNIALGNYTFIISFLFSLVGGAKIILSFEFFKKKLFKTPLDAELDEEEDNKDRIRWEYICVTAGAILIVISYYMVI